ncbi:MAG: restriction endonuclease [Firmicutes bacterium]|nr:restriction endonuclease [Bacillota bacterium]
MSAMRWIELKEYVPHELACDEMSLSDGESLWRRYGTQVNVDFPTPKTDNRWRLTSLGWVGFIPLTSDLGIHLVPKVPVANLFRMLEYAYNLKGLRFLEDIVHCSTLQDFYSSLAKILALRILDRERKGLYRSYRDEYEDVTYLKGRMDVDKHITKPWSTRFDCEFQEHLADIEDNRILAWSLYLIAHNRLCSEEAARICRIAYRKLRASVGLQPFRGRDCVGRMYNRLNQDYEPLHSLCRFFLDHSGPSALVGEYQMLPFLINMPSLFELFVANWLQAHLPPEFRVRPQEQVVVGTSGELVFRIDLVLYDLERGSVCCILDTKYKSSDTPSNEDIAQMFTYELAKECNRAVLVYPTASIKPFEDSIQNKRVKSMAFPLEGDDMEKSGEGFLAQLLSWVKDES